MYYDKTVFRITLQNYLVKKITHAIYSIFTKCVTNNTSYDKKLSLKITLYFKD